MNPEPIRWPGGKRFAFTIVDDTDCSELPAIREVYDFLADCGFRTTKTVWPLRQVGRPITGGQTLQDNDYACWARRLHQDGFEMALHGASDGTSEREHVQAALDAFRQVFGHDPAIHVNHVGQREALYWGAARFDPPVRWLYGLYRKVRSGESQTKGHLQQSPLFWGDLCEQRVTYVRNFVWPEINTAKMDPLMPYFDPSRPYVKRWFSSSYGSGVNRLNALIGEANQDRLAEEGGACIVYTHLGSTFHPLNSRFTALMRRLAGLGGWYVPASTLLEHLGEQRGWVNIAERRAEYLRMQLSWMLLQGRRSMQSAA